MKFSIQKNILQDILTAAISAVPNKSTIQILNNFSLRLEGNFLEVSATDLDLGIRVKVEVSGERDGSVVINARKLFDLVKNLVDPSITTVSIDVQDYLAKIRWSERGQASITGFDASDFPPFPEVEDGETLSFAASELAFLAEKTVFATSNDSTRLSLNGVYLEAKDNAVSMIATDGHRLGKASIDQEGANLSNGAIIPRKALQHILHMAKSDATIEVRTSATHILFDTGSMQVISKLYEGPYPNYRAVIPQHFERTVQANTVELQNKLRSVLPMANTRTRKVRLQMDGNTMELSATDPDVGGTCTEALAVTHQGEGQFSIGFNGQYLAEILGMCKSEEVVMKMNNPIGACIIEPVGDGFSFNFLLMPTHLVDD
ncbi:MAG: DNA polymerase III subunit beta [Fibrobacteraceae bacterium]|nr:DNA polymerase III subunit beta [Fibrobacteraceae bacterium]